MAETDPRMSETEVVGIIARLRPSASHAVDALFEAIGVPHFTATQLGSKVVDTPHSSDWSIITTKAMECRLLELSTKLPREQPTNGRPPIYFRTTVVSERFTEAYNRLHIRLLRQYQPEISTPTIIRRALGVFAASIELRVKDDELETTTLARLIKPAMHPSKIMHRGLEGYESARGLQHRVRRTRKQLVNAYLKSLSSVRNASK